MCQGLILLFVSMSYKQTHYIKLARNQAASFTVNGTAVTFYIKNQVATRRLSFRFDVIYKYNSYTKRRRYHRS